jgi:hypothetical protein
MVFEGRVAQPVARRVRRRRESPPGGGEAGAEWGSAKENWVSLPRLTNAGSRHPASGAKTTEELDVVGLPHACEIIMAKDLGIRIASAADLGALVRLAGAFRDHLGLLTPLDADLCVSIALLLQDAGTEFFLAREAHGMPLGYVQARYRYSAWTSGLEAELEDVFVIRETRRGGVAAHRLRHHTCHRPGVPRHRPQYERAQRRCRGIVRAAWLSGRTGAVAGWPTALAYQTPHDRMKPRRP